MIITEPIIQKALAGRVSHHLCRIPHFTPRKWWECDLFVLTRALYWYEFEIKLSRADYLRDAKKEKYRRIQRRTVSKHEEIGQGKGPNQFWFVTLPDIVKPMEIPSFAGLIEVHADSDSRGGLRVFLQDAVKAPRLHKNKVEAAEQLHIIGNLDWRYHDAKQREAA